MLAAKRTINSALFARIAHTSYCSTISTLVIFHARSAIVILTPKPFLFK
jgi:hypothetical protein